MNIRGWPQHWGLTQACASSTFMANFQVDKLVPTSLHVKRKKVLHSVCGLMITSNFECQICHRMCRSRIGLIAHNKSHSWWWDPSYQRLSPWWSLLIKLLKFNLLTAKITINMTAAYQCRTNSTTSKTHLQKHKTPSSDTDCIAITDWQYEFHELYKFKIHSLSKSLLLRCFKFTNSHLIFANFVWTFMQ